MFLETLLIKQKEMIPENLITQSLKRNKTTSIAQLLSPSPGPSPLFSTTLFMYSQFFSCNCVTNASCSITLITSGLLNNDNNVYSSDDHVHEYNLRLICYYSLLLCAQIMKNNSVYVWLCTFIYYVSKSFYLTLFIYRAEYILTKRFYLNHCIFCSIS